MAADETDRLLLVALQKGLPVDARPFARVGEALGLGEEAVMARVRALFESGVARRFGAVFDSRSLGYGSTLCAAEVPEPELEAAVARIVPHAGITHCYERQGSPNLWFTMTALEAELDREIGRVAEALGRPVLNLPALRTFKIEAVFGKTEERPPSTDEGRPASRAAVSLTALEREVVRRLQSSLAVCEEPYAAVAHDAGIDEAELLALLRRWQREGVVRRIALVLRHRELGFAANSMCVWPAPRDRIERAGASLARSPHVSHCYERPAFEAFPYNLYAMIHARSQEEAVALFERLGAEAGLAGGRMLWSRREFKKTSPVFFCEPAFASGKSGAA